MKPNSRNANDAASAPPPTTSRRRWQLRLVILAGVAVGVWILGDLIYSQIVAWRMAQWEASIERHANGVRVGCEAFSVGDGESAILLVHGINDSPAIYRKMAPRLAEKGFTCRAMRLPGFAMPIDDYAVSTHEQWVAAIKQEAEALSQTHSQVCLVAHSLGGAATIRYLIENPQGADRCVLIAPCVAVSNRRSPVLSVRTWHTLGRWTLFFTRVTETPFPNDARDPSERTYALRTRFCPRTVIDELFLIIDKNRNQASHFRTPLLMILSRDDQVIDWEAAYEFFQQAGSSEKSTFFVENAGHAIPVDYGWERVVDEIAAFAGQQSR